MYVFGSHALLSILMPRTRPRTISAMPSPYGSSSATRFYPPNFLGNLESIVFQLLLKPGPISIAATYKEVLFINAVAGSDVQAFINDWHRSFSSWRNAYSRSNSPAVGPNIRWKRLTASRDRATRCLSCYSCLHDLQNGPPSVPQLHDK
jgi:hypothetical protein